MNKRVLIVIGVVLVAFLVFFAFRWTTGNVIITSEKDDFKVGEFLSGDVLVVLEEKDSLNGDEPIIIYLERNSQILVSDTLVVNGLLSISGKETKRNSDGVIKSIRFNVPLEKLLNYSFEESGDYNLGFAIPDASYVVEKKLIVE